MNVSSHLNMLGLRVHDRVTGFKGVVTTISFDLYGCIQAVVTPAAVSEGKLEDSRWFDVSRLEIESHTPVMDRPNFDTPGPVAEGNKGPAEKPRHLSPTPR